MTLAESFLRGLPAGAPPPPAELEERLGELCRRARAAWPGLELDGDALARHLAAHALPDGVEAYLETVNVEDLALAEACARRDARAIRELDARLRAIVPRALAQMKVPADEIVQRLRERFLVGPDGRGRIADYSGRGSLASWVRAAAVRTALDSLRQDQVERRAAARVDVPVAPDPELELLRARYAGELRVALEEAVAALPARDQNLIRFSYLDGLSIDAIGALYGVHRATASRWLSQARAAIVADARRRLAEKLAISDAELASVVRAVRSQLEISIRGVLG